MATQPQFRSFLPSSAHNNTTTNTNNNDKEKYTSTSQTPASQHQDFVHDIAFDHYGRRIATCSGDKVKVWDLDEKGDWVFSPGCGSDWKAHRGSVTKISWAHPEFGQLLATCGTDHAAIVWEELDTTFSSSSLDNNTDQSMATQPEQQQQTQVSRWIDKVQLTDATKACTCIEFSPRHLGLKLATGSHDGYVRIYEAIDIMNLNHWSMSGQIEAEVNEELGISSLSWCRGRFEPPTLVVGGASSGRVTVYSYSDASRTWYRLAELNSHQGKGVYDVSWAPNVGRSFHLIASAGKDQVLKVHRLNRKTQQNINKKQSEEDDGKKKNSSFLEYASSQNLESSEEEVWRVAWNVTGTVLASSGDGGIVKLWKCDFKYDNWKCVSEVHGGQPSSAPFTSANSSFPASDNTMQMMTT
eukprot:CAMPEP_0178968760 /NCGR_PEP_ID=MMETSP0789-20121207/18448_1 /TAXON_ID=3005 /ORGANISM="Rhizosolenia setigera, Strain CCMP 1694" /LENGTH=411 /DNA_ID=CAMNT_0020654755 /DNA_START=282 /DNA_END=1514 /DNA_ORIENTATION=+